MKLISEIHLSKKIIYILLLLIGSQVIQSKGCKQNPPTPRPAPSVTKVPGKIQMPFIPREYNPTGPINSTTKIQMPTKPGYNAFSSSLCDFTVGNIDDAKMYIKYTDAAGNKITYSTQNLLNSMNGSTVFQRWESDVEYPETGDYWIEIVLKMRVCSTCCGLAQNNYPFPGTGTVGCDAIPQTNNIQQGKVTITAIVPYGNASTYYFYSNSFDLNKSKVECDCNCP